jgi:hypothetical protein
MISDQSKGRPTFSQGAMDVKSSSRPAFLQTPCQVKFICVPSNEDLVLADHTEVPIDSPGLRTPTPITALRKTSELDADWCHRIVVEPREHCKVAHELL